MSFKTKRLRLLLLAGLSAPLILATLAFGVAAEERSPVTFLTDPARLEAVRLPQELRWASDVRWHKGSVVLVSGGRAGTRALDLADPEFRITEIYRPSTFFGVAGFHYTLARTRDWIFFGGAVRAVMWREVDRGPQDEYRYNDMSLDGILDMDASGSDLVFLAARRGQKDNRFSPDGVIGWRASVVKDGLDYIPFFISSSGPRASNMDRCGSMSPGKVRYLRDGSYLFVPGVEPGVFLYSSESLLKKTWDTAELGIDAECHLTKEASMRYSLDEPRRHKEWLARRRILDEIMPFPKGPGLVVRRREDGLTRWRVTTLRASGEFTHEELPIVSRSHYARVRGDVREDGAIVYLVRDPDLDRDDPERPIYLFVSKEVLDVKAAAEPAESPRPPGD